MDYIIIDQEDLGMVGPKECGDIPAVQREVLGKLKAGRTPRVFVEVPYDVSVKVKEDKIGETATGKTKPGKGAGGPGNSEVRRGDETAAPELGEGGGDPIAGPSAEDK